MPALRRLFALAALLTYVTLAPAPLAGVSTTVVISQVYGGGGNSGATYRNDFIELHNRGTSTVTLTGWSVQYAASTGSTWQRTPLSGMLAPGQYYLVQEAQGAGGTVNLPAPDATGTIPMAAGAGKVVLVNFWATWCEPCKIEIPELIELQQEYGPKGFTVLGIAMDDEGRSAVAPFVQKEKFDTDAGKSAMNYPIVIGNDAAGDKFGGLLGYPTSILLSRDGKQVKHITGIITRDDIVKSIQAQP